MVEKTHVFFCLHDTVVFSIEGSGPLLDYVKYQYSYFQERDAENNLAYEPILLKFVDIGHVASELFLKSGNESYVKSKEKFIWRVGNSKLALDGNRKLVEQTELLFDQQFNKMKANLICELLWRLRFVSERIILVHAACVANGNQAMLLPAWKGTGKTAVCLKLIEAGYNFLGDDKVWLSITGEIFAYPRYVVIKGSNALHFPEFTNAATKAKSYLQALLKKSGLLNRVRLFRYLAKKLFTIPVRYHYIEDLYPGAKTVKQAQLTNIVYLAKGGRTQHVTITDFSPEVAASHIYQISNVEWNYSLLSFASAHDILFPDGPKWTAEILNLMAQEENLLDEVLKKRKCFAAVIPLQNHHIKWDDFVSKIEQL
jgi:hypothetical protein